MNVLERLTQKVNEIPVNVQGLKYANVIVNGTVYSVRVSMTDKVYRKDAQQVDEKSLMIL